MKMKALKTSILASAAILSLMAATSVHAEGRLSKVTKEVAVQEQKVNDLKKNLESAKADQQMKQSSKDQTSADLTNASSDLEKLEAKKSKSLKTLNVSTEDLKKKTESIKRKEKEVKNREETLSSSMNFAKILDGVDGVVEIFQGKDSQLDNLKSELSKLEKEEDKLLVEQSESRSQYDSTKKQYDELQNKVRYVSLDRTSKEEELKKATDKVSEIEASLAKESKTLEEKRAQKKDVEANLAKYAIGDTESDFNGEEDQALFNQTKDRRDAGDEGLTNHTRQMRQFIIAKFGIKVAGGYRHNDDDGTGHGHGSGMAVDFMADKATGDKIAKYMQRNFKSLGIYYIIWEQRYYMNITNIYGPANTWNLMDDRGSATQNHYDHVHVSFAK